MRATDSVSKQGYTPSAQGPQLGLCGGTVSHETQFGSMILFPRRIAVRIRSFGGSPADGHVKGRIAQEASCSLRSL